MLRRKENKSSNVGLPYPLYQGDGPTTAEEWLKKKRLRDNTEGLWRIHDELYDLTDFVDSHPGGAQWINSSKGTDITEAFEIHHLKGVAETYLSNYLVRKATTPRIQPFTFEKEGFYKTLKPKIVSKLSEIPESARKGSDRIIDSLLIVFVLLTPVSCWAWNISSILGLLIIISNSLLLNFLVTSAHSYFHRSDNWRMYLFNLNGQSYKQWRISHALSHHIFTNTIQDAEIRLIEPILQLLPYKNKPLWAQMAVFYWPLAGLILFVRPVWRQLFGSTKKLEEYTFEWPQLIQFFLPVWIFLSWEQSLLSTLLLWMVTSFLTSFFFVFFGLTAGHHSPESIFEGDIPSDKPIDWGAYQLKVVIERTGYADNHFLAITQFGDHSLHHLFPTLDHAELKYLYPVLSDHCKEFGIELRTRSFLTVLVNLFKQILRKGPKKLSIKSYFDYIGD